MGFCLSKKAASLSAVLLVCGFTACTSRRPLNGTSAPTRASVSTVAGNFTRRVYPYSLIPGGVESAAELQTYSAVDRTLADHYSGLGDGLVITKVDQDQRLYASYRVADAIYWTKNRIVVHAGEDILSNGKDMVRARCGNRLSNIAQTPVRQFEPPPVYTDRFIPEIVVLQPPSVIEPYVPPMLPDFPLVAPPERTGTPPALESGGGRTGVPPAILTGGGKVPTGIYVPEPDSWMLLLIGLVGICSAGCLRTVWKRSGSA